VTGSICVLGGTGLLGRAVTAELTRRGRLFTAPPRGTLDLAGGAAIGAGLEALRPAAIVNLAGFTDVGAAERPENRSAAVAFNAELPGLLAAACARLEIPFVHVSTDYVFDGAKKTPYLESDLVNPTQVYGATKLDGETAAIAENARVLIVRVSTLYGPDRPQRPAYVDAILSQARARAAEGGGAIEVVEPPVSSPTYAPDVAPALIDLMDRGTEGIVHVVNDGAASRLELATAAVALAGLGERVAVRVRPEPPGGLRRPAYSVLDTTKLHGLIGRKLPPWKDALGRYIGSELRVKS
jgi:dTDP-4-dehydrorhamnose reductase